MTSAANANKPALHLVGCDGNAFAILSKAHRAAKGANWSCEKIDEVMHEATCGDYNHLIQTMIKYFEVSVGVTRKIGATRYKENTRL
tara:strand:- start:659 stop:919 length:261 start_codon:yes stop_codon:yes gene_type:complete